MSVPVNLKKGAGGRTFGEFFNLIGLISAFVALFIEQNSLEGDVAAASLGLAIVAGVAVFLAGVSIVVYVNRFMFEPGEFESEADKRNVKKARRLSYLVGFLWILLAGGAAAAAGIMGFAGSTYQAVSIVGAISVFGWCLGEIVNMGSLFVLNKLSLDPQNSDPRLRIDVIWKALNWLEIICSGLKAVGLGLMAIGVVIPQVEVLVTGSLVASGGVVINLLRGIWKLRRKAV